MQIKDGLVFDDVLIVPNYSDIESRSNVDLSVELPKGFKVSNPLIPANMATVTGYQMAKTAADMKSMAIIHRFMHIQEQFDLISKLDKNSLNYVGISIGVKEEDKKNVDVFVGDLGVKIICIDIAHGDSNMCISMCHHISKKYPEVLLIAGNVATGSGARRLWEAGADIVKIGIGGGCFAAGTRVLMSTGLYKNIEEIIPGDRVINKDGNPVTVIDSFCTGTKKVIEIKNNSFYKNTSVTEDHNFWVGDLSSVNNNVKCTGYKRVLDKKSKTKPKASKYKWKKISDADGDVFLFPKNIKFEFAKQFKINLVKRIGGNYKSGHVYEDDSLMEPSYDLGYLFGTFLGDGCSLSTKFNGSNIGSVTWYFGLHENDIAKKLSNAIEKIFNKKPKIYREDGKNIIIVKFYYKPLADFLKLFGKKSEKKLPDELFVDNVEYLKGIYDGLIDSDGNDDNGRLSLSNTSPKIIELFNIINFILYEYLPNSSKKQKSVGGLKGCNFDNLSDSYFSRTLKNSKARLTKDYYIVKNLGHFDNNLNVPVYDITVDCDTHSFIANNMIVHNSICTTRIEAAAGVPLLTSLIDVAEEREKLRATGLEKWQKPLLFISDGGVNKPSDCVKALCLADLVMAGNIFAGTIESPGETIEHNGMLYKEYSGSSTYRTEHVEGVRAMVPQKGPVADVYKRYLQGIKSGCSYQGVSNLVDLKDNPQFIKITNSGIRESGAHDVTLK